MIVSYVPPRSLEIICRPAYGNGHGFSINYLRNKRTHSERNGDVVVAIVNGRSNELPWAQAPEKTTQNSIPAYMQVGATETTSELISYVLRLIDCDINKIHIFMAKNTHALLQNYAVSMYLTCYCVVVICEFKGRFSVGSDGSFATNEPANVWCGSANQLSHYWTVFN